MASLKLNLVLWVKNVEPAGYKKGHMPIQYFKINHLLFLYQRVISQGSSGIASTRQFSNVNAVLY